MSKFIIKGPSKLSGEVQISGSKNAALPIICASILNKGKTILKNVPEIADIKSLIEILNFLGAKTKFENNILEIDGKNIQNKEIPRELVEKIRGAILLLGPLLARFGEVKMSYPGGCIIGKRPIDSHLNAFLDFGVKLVKDENFIHLKLENISNNKITLSEMSVTATENLLSFCSVLDFSDISLCAMEPHVVDTYLFLEKLGVKIEGKKSHNLKIYGKKDFDLSVEHTICGDYIEAGTFAIAAVATESNLKIKGIKEEDLDSFWVKMKEMGVKFKHFENGTEILETKNLKAVNIKTSVFPGFPTDLQAPFSILQLKANGVSKIFETLFEKRFNYLFELEKMGAQIEFLNNHQIMIIGGENLIGTQISSCDLRAGATCVLAGLMAKGETEVLGIDYIDRGYEDFDKKLRGIGVDIKRV